MHEPVADADGNVYKTVKIGSQIWTVENLKTTKYCDSSSIAHITDNTEWRNANYGAFCYYDNNQFNNEKYGVLYNWYAVQSGKLAPDGWHVPTDEDWNILEKYLKKYGYNKNGTRTGGRIGKTLASAANWAPIATGGNIGNSTWENNGTGFSALPGGYRYINGDFISHREMGFYWSSTETGRSYAWDRHLSYDSDYLYRESRKKTWGLSVRLVKNGK